MLGLPGSPGPVGFALLALGLTAAALLGWRSRSALPAGPFGAALLACAVITLGAGPFLAWRFVEDMRYTTGLNSSDYEGAGPIQAFLQPYLLDGVPPLVPRGDTYFAAVGESVPYSAARKAFPSLAVNVLFPRRSVARARDADWILAWGVDPGRFAPVGEVRVVRPAAGGYPALRLARVQR